MKKNLTSLAVFLSLVAILATSTYAQLAEEIRPFDFNDGVYSTHGIDASTLLNRKNGADKKSVFDVTTDPRIYNDIRVTETLPAYLGDGGIAYWNHFADATKESFTGDPNGEGAYALANAFPIYVFPSALTKGSDRQAAMFRVDEVYYQKNVIGISALMIVEYTDRAFTKKGTLLLRPLADRNGLSADGTPIIKTAKELEELLAEQLVTVRQSDLGEGDRGPFMIARIIRHPENGGITPDAFLNYVKESGSSNDPLVAEQHFVSRFECLRAGGPCF